MSAVIDASLVVPLATVDPRAEAVSNALKELLTEGHDLHAPALLPYEVASALTRAIAARAFDQDNLLDAWQRVLSLPIEYHRLSTTGQRVVEIALQLERKSAYDAAYLALAEQLGCAVWTIDKSLARNATGRGFAVQLVEH